MERCTPNTRLDEAGYLLVEAVVAVALIAVSAGAALSAVAAVTHAAARALPASALALSAQNVLTDLRAATAYDPAALSALAGKSVSFDADEPAQGKAAQRIHIIASVTHSNATNRFAASVTARAANGTAVTVQATLVQEAPAPGSVISASSSAARPPGSGNATIALPGCDTPQVECTSASGPIAL